MKKFLVSIFFFFILVNRAFGEKNYRDPFVSLLPGEREGEQSTIPTESSQAVSLPSLDVKVQGIVWSDNPLAIIEGEVYGKGDSLKNFDAQILDIEKGKVFILYNGVVLEKSIEKLEYKGGKP
ncbi:MAG: hypothetical protein NC822_00495 [Candidatus Omnitrophica bacterium]|nr:hypothetical protein [Candidatus Omnitrophota bacterium]MCM8826550.1 hypothetical protein [Candidatus Omnitrophota bacterium]